MVQTSNGPGDGHERYRPFLNSCVCGLTAEASARTKPDLKKRLGVVAYVLSTMQHTRQLEMYEAVTLDDVQRVAQRAGIDYLATGAADRLLRRGASHLTRLKVPHLVVDASKPRQFSLDGETVERRHLEANSRQGAMRFMVGEAYQRTPEENPVPR